MCLGLLIYLTYGIYNSTECKAGDQDVVLYNVTENLEEDYTNKPVYINRSCETDIKEEESLQ